MSNETTIVSGWKSIFYNGQVAKFSIKENSQDVRQGYLKYREPLFFWLLFALPTLFSFVSSFLSYKSLQNTPNLPLNTLIDSSQNWTRWPEVQGERVEYIVLSWTYSAPFNSSFGGKSISSIPLLIIFIETRQSWDHTTRRRRWSEHTNKSQSW